MPNPLYFGRFHPTSGWSFPSSRTPTTPDRIDSYVHCNPITSFDPLGLSVAIFQSYDKRSNETHIQIYITASIVDQSGREYGPEALQGMASDIKAQLEKTYSGDGVHPVNGGKVTWSTMATIKIRESIDNVDKNDHVIHLRNGVIDPDSLKEVAGLGEYGGKESWINMSLIEASAKLSVAEVVAHELGHNLFLHHPNPSDPNNTSKDEHLHDGSNPATRLSPFNIMRTGEEHKGDMTEQPQAHWMLDRYNKGLLNQNINGGPLGGINLDDTDAVEMYDGENDNLFEEGGHDEG